MANSVKHKHTRFVDSPSHDEEKFDAANLIMNTTHQPQFKVQRKNKKSV